MAAGHPAAVNATGSGKAAQTVEVVEMPNFLQTESADLTTTFKRQMVENLPNFGMIRGNTIYGPHLFYAESGADERGSDHGTCHVIVWRQA